MHKTRITQRSHQTKRSQENKNKQNREQNYVSKSTHEEARTGLALSKMCNQCQKTPATGKARQLLAVWNGCDVVSYNIVHACARKQALPNAWFA